MQLIRLLICAVLIAIAFFCVLDHIGEYVVEEIEYNAIYIDEYNKHYIKELQQYIDENQITTKDVDKLDKWVTQQKIIVLRIYKDHQRVFDSEYSTQEVWDSDVAWDESSGQIYYPIQFIDGEARAKIVGAYIYKIYNTVLIAEILLSMGLFLVLVILGIRGKMKYILKLSEEIEILEGGSLDYPITVKGKDELAVLAQGLESMRCSFQKLIEEESKMRHENQKIVTEMSHDLRTPITSIMLCTEILKKGSYENQDKLLEYLNKIDKKARRMKQLTDNLFEYSLVIGKEEIELETIEPYEILFYDLFSETYGYLEQKGFIVESHIKWSQVLLEVCSNYLIRIMDNITSNIIKYADPNKKIEITSLYQEKKIGFSFRNAKKNQEKKVESTCVGIQSIKSMMNSMGGSCEVDENELYFVISILFPIKIGQSNNN